MIEPKHTVPAWLAIMTAVNIVVGGSFFLNASLIAQSAGGYAPLAWVLVGVMLLPLVYILAGLSTQYPLAGGLYVYSRELISPFAGVLSGTGYFIGTAAGNAVILHACVRKLQDFGVLPSLLESLPHNLLLWDLLLVCVVVGSNFFNIVLLRKVQVGLTILKLIPLVLVVGALFAIGSWDRMATAPLMAEGLLVEIPKVVFSYIGIEACSSLTHTLRDPKRDASRVLLLSFVLIVGIYTFLQTALLMIHGYAQNDLFGTLVALLVGDSPSTELFGRVIVQTAIAVSFFGGFYSMFYANNWNLMALAEERAIAGLTKKNKYGAPINCLIAQGLMIACFLIWNAEVSTLITMSDFGTILAYILSCVAFLRMAGNTYQRTVGVLGLTACLYFFYICLTNLIHDGPEHIVPFALMLFGGALLLRPKHTLASK